MWHCVHGCVCEMLSVYVPCASHSVCRLASTVLSPHSHTILDTHTNMPKPRTTRSLRSTLLRGIYKWGVGGWGCGVGTRVECVLHCFLPFCGLPVSEKELW